ncbi:hypothetical protein MWH28_07845 [Natroniella sulfidigena]|uniref:hypothetical protein n=1 Tax=Natroniella sulfidigena TaxID=723921 RepID=UPI00200B3383|nr:hypothetical protein [Natroniella sulfidigena]MCK8817272.1 hypothetical protein [Natroniella sulfidigena]
MNTKFIISVSFIFIVLIEAIILLKNFFNKDKTNTQNSLNLLFRFISNSFIYVSSLLVLIATLTNLNLLTIDQLTDLNDITLGQTAILIIIFTNVITIVSILIGGLNKLKTKKQNNKLEHNIVDQEEAKKII